MDQFKLIVENTTANQRVYLTVFCPVQQFHHQIRNILGQCPKMKDMPFTIYHTHGPCTKHTRFFYQTPRHNVVGSQQIVHRIGIKFIQSLIDLIGVFYFRNIFGRCQNMFSIEHSSYLFQRKRILLNCQRPVNGADTVTAA